MEPRKGPLNRTPDMLATRYFRNRRAACTASAKGLACGAAATIVTGLGNSRMNNDVLWLVRLGIDQGLLEREHCIAVRKKVGEAAEIGDFAQQLIDDGHVDDVASLEKIAGLAMAKGQKSAPLSDPFESSDTAAPFIPKQTAEQRKASLATNAGPVPHFDFDTLGVLDDGALAAGLRGLLRATARHLASDLHLSTGTRPFIRKNRQLTFISDYKLTADDALRLNTALLSEGQKKIFLQAKDYDYALALSATDRYRVNLMFHKNGAAGSYRMVPDKVRTLADLGYSAHIDTLKRLLSYHNGLILITGPVGSGKTTTLASMVSYLNETRTDHIITVEDPIEVVQAAKGCNVTQREVGPHTKSFFTALKGALREDPDIIVIGELRDLETIEMAITASETGHLVIGTMHTSDAATTLNRLLDVFPPSQQTQIRASVAESLRGVVCQRLLPSTEGGLTLACEILINNTAIQNLIREGKAQGLRNTMETGVREGMCLMDNVVFALWQGKKITPETALANISNRVLRAKIS
ncbi:MAG: pilT 1 [Verrucomicrobia bacterium]|nr:pilT 1 [Verrucomicrobiota bacterium]